MTQSGHSSDARSEPAVCVGGQECVGEGPLSEDPAASSAVPGQETGTGQRQAAALLPFPPTPPAPPSLQLLPSQSISVTPRAPEELHYGTPTLRPEK